MGDHEHQQGGHDAARHGAARMVQRHVGREGIAERQVSRDQASGAQRRAHEVHRKPASSYRQPERNRDHDPGERRRQRGGGDERLKRVRGRG